MPLERDDRQRGGQQGGGDDRTSADVAADSERSVKAPGPSSRRRLESDLCFETWPAACDQVIARIREARVARLSVHPVRAPSRHNGRVGHLQLGAAGAAGELFDRAAVEIRASENPSRQVGLPASNTSSTRLTVRTARSNRRPRCRRMLVMMLRTVTMMADLPLMLVVDDASAVVPCRASCSSSHSNAGAILGS